MDIKISFHHMDHSDPLDAHVRQKLKKLEEINRTDFESEPFFVEAFLTANRQHMHNRADFTLKTPRFSLEAHAEDPDMYWAVDHAIDRLVEQLVKHKNMVLDKEHKPMTAKRAFTEDEDKYTLSEDD